MTALTRIEHAAKLNDWDVDLTPAHRDRGAYLHMTRGLDRLDIELDKAERVLWVGRYHDDAMNDSLQPYEFDKLATVLNWMQHN